ncbi:hypothetical protein [Natronococcus sp. A-GB7]|uniref:hypothetical protein n=1 Tax=Natronococcus sp. A-GB7 TaxID=3037649 RepID=UPI00241DDE05|nr:hypothetical protein [Natronococcus sp. A-GB7]MDG5821204.1 hypothetical protein [Natronococcus sp. A-GB7]
MTFDRSGTRTPATPSVSRRRYLAVGATVGATAVAGCSSAVDFLAGMALEDVNVLNGGEQDLTGSVEVAGPDGSLVLEDRFALAPDDDDTEDAQATYDGVLTDSGEYTVTLELDNGDEDALDDQVIENSVEVAEPDEEHVIVFFGPAETDDAVAMTVIEELSDLEERGEFDDVDF